MKRTGILLASALALGVNGQSYNPLAFSQSNDGTATTMPTNMPSMGVTTVTIDVYESCTDTTYQGSGMNTVTSTITETYCPLCTDMPNHGMDGAVASGHTTVYTTVWQELCSTGLRDKTWTVTESCTDDVPTWSSGPDYVPQGYTTTVTVCTVCGKKPTPVTLTVPCTDSPAPAGMPAAPNMATPTAAPASPADSSAAPASAANMPSPMATPACAGNGTCPSNNMTMPSSLSPYKPDSFTGSSSRQTIGKAVTIVAVACGVVFSFSLF